MDEVKRYTVPGRYLVDSGKNPGAQDVVLASDYAAIEAELARLRAGQEPVALQVVAHTQGNLMKSIGHFTDCRTDEGVTVGLIDTIINSARLLATRNLNHPAIVEAIKDLCGDSDVLKLVSPQPSAGVVMPEPYGWIAAGNFYTEREAAISAAGKTPCIEVYSRRQMDASERRSAERQGVAEELARLLNAAGNETRELLARLNGKEVGRG